MVNIKSVILNQETKPYWADSSKSTIDSKILNLYIKGEFDVELIEDIFSFTDNVGEVVNFKTVIKVFNNGNLVKRKLFWMGYDKWSGFTHEMLINETFKTIN